MNWRLEKKNNKAYLLIELMVTVIILGLAICFIAQAFSSSLFAVRKAIVYSKALIFSERLVWDKRLDLALSKPISKEDFPESFNRVENNINFQVEEVVLETGFPNLAEIIFDVSWKDAKASGEFKVSTFMPIPEVK